METKPRIQVVYKTKVNLDEETILERIDLLKHECEPVKRVFPGHIEPTTIQLVIRPKYLEHCNLQVSFNGTINITCSNYRELWVLENQIKKITKLKDIEPVSIRMIREENIEYINEYEFLRRQIWWASYELSQYPEEFKLYSYKDDENPYGVSTKIVSRQEKFKELKEKWYKILCSEYPIE